MLTASALAAHPAPITAVHLFVALRRLQTSVAARCLRVLGLDWSALEAPSAGCVRGGRGETPLILSHVAAELLGRASDEAAALGHHPVTTGHLVLAILAEEAGALPVGALTHEAFVRTLKDVLGRPWVHGHALDGELAFHVSCDEALVLFGLALRRGPRGLDPAERVVLRDLARLLRPVCEQLLGDGPERLEHARREVEALGRVVAGPDAGAGADGS